MYIQATENSACKEAPDSVALSKRARVKGAATPLLEPFLRHRSAPQIQWSHIQTPRNGTRSVKTLYVHLCVYMCVSTCAPVEVRGQLQGRFYFYFEGFGDQTA